MSTDPLRDVLAALTRLEAAHTRLHRDIDALRADVLTAIRLDVMTILRNDVIGRLADVQNALSDLQNEVTGSKDEAP